MEGKGPLLIRRNGQTLFARVHRPHGFFCRARGLIARPALQSDQAWWFDRCNSIHMFGMTRRIDVIFLDRAGAVVKLKRQLPPFAVAFCGKAANVVEIAAGGVDQKEIKVGQLLELVS
jgi:uncharacterized membrane protein (UPF0127 family)